jgi:sugar/nucleoside kinase (ribokinase family)
LVLVTPDGEPTFAINPGVADEFPSGPLKEWPDQPSYLLLEGNLLYRRAHFESLIALLSAFGGESTRLRKILTLHACTDMSPEGMMICCEALPKFDFILGNKAEMLAFGPAIEDRRRDAADWRPVLLSTLGPEGVTIEDVAGVRKISAAVPPRVVDAVGAGDAFLGGLIYGLLRDGPVEHAVECGIQWATRKLSEAGSRPRLSELSV